jgi:hypothetical protein
MCYVIRTDAYKRDTREPSVSNQPVGHSMKHAKKTTAEILNRGGVVALTGIS